MEKVYEAAENCDPGACRVRVASSCVHGPRSLEILPERPQSVSTHVLYISGGGLHGSTCCIAPTFPVHSPRPATHPCAHRPAPANCRRRCSTSPSRRRTVQSCTRTRTTRSLRQAAPCCVARCATPAVPGAASRVFAAAPRPCDARPRTRGRSSRPQLPSVGSEMAHASPPARVGRSGVAGRQPSGQGSRGEKRARPTPAPLLPGL